MPADQEDPSLATPTTAGLMRRVAAMFYDSLLLFAIGMSVSALFVALRVLIESEDVVRADARAVSGPLLQNALMLSVTMAIALFYGWFWTRSGQTLGMQAWRLRLQRADGGCVSWRQAMTRLAAALLSWLCLGAGYWWLLFDKDGCTWHDRLSNTRIVLLPKTP
jgi:uncharacterized RDD family membrane protein YckC